MVGLVLGLGELVLEHRSILWCVSKGEAEGELGGGGVIIIIFLYIDVGVEYLSSEQIV